MSPQWPDPIKFIVSPKGSYVADAADEFKWERSYTYSVISRLPASDGIHSKFHAVATVDPQLKNAIVSNVSGKFGNVGYRGRSNSGHSPVSNRAGAYVLGVVNRLQSCQYSDKITTTRFDLQGD